MTQKALPARPAKKPVLRWIAFAALVAIAVLCIGLGIVQEQPNAVLQKAIRICLECIGIG